VYKYTWKNKKITDIKSHQKVSKLGVHQRPSMTDAEASKSANKILFGVI
jgi:hypothetical protein